MSDNQELHLTKTAAAPLARPEGPSVAEILKAIVEKGISPENVGALEKIVGLYERMEAKNAEKAFAAAFVRLQAELKSVRATRIVPNNDGTPRYKFAPFEQIMEQVRPVAEKHGFTITFSTEYQENRLVKACTLQHIDGHSRTNQFTVRVGKGPPGASESQADGAASTYAKRFALCDALNIQIDHDSDANAVGQPITPEQAADLERRVTATKSDRELFLRLAGAKTFAEIMSSRYEDLDAALAKRERIQKTKADADIQRRINEGRP